jgi:hypothetical protein
LIKYTLKNNAYSTNQVCEDLNISERELRFAKINLFTLTEHQKCRLTNSEITDWCLTNDALFNYLQYKEFEYSFANPKKSHWIAVIALIISTLSLLFSVFGLKE